MSKEDIMSVIEVVTSILDARHRLRQACADLRAYNSTANPHSQLQVGDFDAERHVKRFFTLSNNATNHEAVRMCVQGLHEDLDEMCSLVRSLSTKRPDRSFGNAGSPAGSCVSEEDEDQSTSKASVQYSPAKENCAGKSDLITECDCTDGSDSGSCVTENDEEEWEDCEEGNGQSETSSNSDDVGTETVKAQEILQQSEKSIPVALETMQETRKREEREKEREEWEIERDEVRRQMECLLLHLANGEREREREMEEERRKEAWIRCARVAARERERLIRALVAGRMGCSACCRCLKRHEMKGHDDMPAGRAIPPGETGSRQLFSATPRTRSLHDGCLRGELGGYRTSVAGSQRERCELTPATTGLPFSPNFHHPPMGAKPHSHTPSPPGVGPEVWRSHGRWQSGLGADVAVCTDANLAQLGVGDGGQYTPRRGGSSTGAATIGGTGVGAAMGGRAPSAVLAQRQPRCSGSEEDACGGEAAHCTAGAHDMRCAARRGHAGRVSGSCSPLSTPSQHVRQLSALWGLHQGSREAEEGRGHPSRGVEAAGRAGFNPLQQQRPPSAVPAGSLQAGLGHAEGVMQRSDAGGAEKRILVVGEVEGYGVVRSLDYSPHSVAGVWVGSASEFDVGPRAKTPPTEGVVQSNDAGGAGKRIHAVGDVAGPWVDLSLDCSTEPMAGLRSRSLVESEVESSVDSEGEQKGGVVQPVRSPEAALEAMRLMDELLVL